MLETLVAYKDAFFYVPFGVDVLLCLVQWPMFAYCGPDWLLKTLAGEKAHSSPGYVQLYDLFMLCYTGYCFMFFYGLYTVVNHQHLVPVMACVQAGIIFMKMLFMFRMTSRGKAADPDLVTKKDTSLYIFYLPLYTCYFALQYLA